MSYFDDASLVMIPSGYKTSKVYSVKPLDGTGDLTFTRSNDTATRVAPNGLIEKVRTNLILQSNTFSDAAWTKSNATLTSGQSGYDGTSNAWLLQNTTSASTYISQAPSTTGIVTYSVYAKAGTVNWVRFSTNGFANGSYFNLADGTTGTSAGLVARSITSVGGGWYRITISHTGTTGMFIFPASADNTLANTAGNNILIQNAQIEAGDIATEPITTLASAVSVGPIANVPRLDYLGSSCPRLLLEPQATAYNTNSENAAGWSVVASSVTSNATTAPDGYNGADLLTYSSSGARIQQDITLADTKLTLSVFVKGNSGNGAALLIRNVSTSTNIAENYFTGNTFTPQSGDYSATSTSFGNGWYRISITATSGITSGNIIRGYVYTDSASGTVSGSSVYVWGMNMTNTSYLQSYIPTLGASVTRGADAASKTGISSLIGQTEGAIFVDLDLSVASEFEHLFNVLDSTNTESILVYLRNTNRIRFAATGTTNYDDVEISSGRHKVAVVWNGSNISYFRDGSKLTTRTGFAKTLTFSDFYLGNRTDADENPEAAHQVLIFTSALTDAQAIALTTL